MYAFHASGGPCRMVGDYQILETLGEGLTSKVKKGRNVNTGHVVALKVLFQDSDEERRQAKVKRFGEEAQAMGICNGHRNTVNLIDVLVHALYPKQDGTIEIANILVLELCAHGELFRLLTLGGDVPPLPSYIAREYFHQLMDGLLYCHSRGVIHRDLKPQNLLIDSEFGLKIADFGFAATGRPHMLCGSMVGTHAYTAPEVIGDTTFYSGPQADVWSAGVVLFFMVVGHLPMERADSGDWWFRALKLGRHDLFWQSHESRLKFSLPTDAKLLINVMLVPDPSRRINVEQIMAHSYLRSRQLPRGSFYGEIRSEMSIIYELRKACNNSAAHEPVTTTDSGTSSSEDTGLGTADAAAIGAVLQPHAGGSRRHNAYPFYSETFRSIGDDQPVGPPEISVEAAAAVTGGFMTYGQPKAVIKALERILHGMGAKIAGVQPDGARTFRTYFTVSAVIPPGPSTGGGSGVGIVANIYRISKDVPMERDGLNGAGAPNLVVVLRRKGGDYYRYGIVEKRIIDQMTTRATNAMAIIERRADANRDQHGLIPTSTLPGDSGGQRRRSVRQRFFGRIVQQ